MPSANEAIAVHWVCSPVLKERLGSVHMSPEAPKPRVAAGRAFGPAACPPETRRGHLALTRPGHLIRVFMISSNSRNCDFMIPGVHGGSFCCDALRMQ
jgi:hypothetical protein